MEVSVAMKGSLLRALLASALLLVILDHRADEEPRIVSIALEGDDVVVEVQVPEGVGEVILESRGRLLAGNWIPRRVVRTGGGEETLVLRVPRNRSMEMLRVIGNATPRLPSAFYEGERTFAGPIRTAQFRLMPVMEDGTALTEVAGPETDREVVESDIWRIAGDRLYFFNRYLGLQVLDISDPDAPVLEGNLHLPASGEQMYVLASGHAVLLARDSCSYFGGGAESRVVLVDTAGGTPSLVASIPVAGRILESRMVGSALYVASQTYRPMTEWDEDGRIVEERWDWGTWVSSHDLSDPGTPVTRDEFWIPGSGHVIHATPRHLFVSTQGRSGRWWQSQVEVIDISSPDGKLSRLSSITPAGRVADKFKMNMSGDVFTVISEVGGNDRLTRLETWDLSTPERPVRMGSVDVGRGERLYATRFDGDKAYIVTYFRIDPLWVVDLSDPSSPVISGELEVPGWSTYIQPLGDRLLSIGIDDTEGFRVAVSLFDVADPSRPGLLSRVPLGTSHSWSEANYDEKALGFLPDAGLVLVPFGSWEEEGRSTGVQLVEIGDDQLFLRGSIDDEVTPRRTALHRDRILSLSGKSLLTVDASDLDSPALVHRLDLSWAVDRVYRSGDHLVELTRGNRWNNESPAVRIVAGDNPEVVLSRVDLGDLPVIGARIDQGRLYLVQSEGDHGWYAPLEEGGEGDEEEASVDLRLSVLDVSGLPSIPVLSSADHVIEGTRGFSGATLHFTGEGVVTVSLDESVYFFRRGFWDDIIWPWGGQRRRFLTFSLPDAELLSDVRVDPENSWESSEVYQQDALLCMSFREEVETHPPEEEDPLSDDPEPGIRKQLYFLHVVDFSDPSFPVSRERVNIPGTLVGLGRDGTLLYTLAPHWDEETGKTDWVPWLDASAYDGVAAHLVDSVRLSRHWQHPVRVEDDLVHIGIPGGNSRGEPDTDHLALYRVTDRARWEKRAEVPLPREARSLHLLGDLLLAQVQEDVWFFDRSQPESLRFLGVGRPPGCFGLSLEHADASADGGILVPGGDYGISRLVPVPDAQQVAAVHWGRDRGTDCEKDCYLRLEIRSHGVEAEDGDREYASHHGLAPGLWGDLLAAVDLPAMETLARTLECADCETGPREWIRVFTHAGAVHLTWPGGRADGPTLPDGTDAVASLVDILVEIHGTIER